MSKLPKEPVKLVPVPSTNKIPERDIGQSPILECRHLGIDFGGLAAVKDFNMAIGRTEIAGLIGPNGAGKTTVFNLLTKVYQPTRGSILIDGQETSRMNTVQVNRAGIARTFQNIRLFKEMSVLDNIRVAINHTMRYPVISSFFRLPGYWREEGEAEERARELLGVFGMESVVDQMAANLPYGMQRKLEILRALAADPQLLLLDEPAAGMKPTETHELMEVIRSIRERFQVAILLIEHDMSLVMNVCERLYVLDYGQLIASGTPDDIRRNEKVITAYLGG